MAMVLEAGERMGVRIAGTGAGAEGGTVDRADFASLLTRFSARLASQRVQAVRGSGTSPSSFGFPPFR